MCFPHWHWQWFYSCRGFPQTRTAARSTIHHFRQADEIGDGMTSERSPCRTSKPQACPRESTDVIGGHKWTVAAGNTCTCRQRVRRCANLCFMFCYNILLPNEFPHSFFLFFPPSPCKIALGDSSAEAKSKYVDATVKWTLEAAKVQLSLQLKVTFKAANAASFAANARAHTNQRHTIPLSKQWSVVFQTP